MTGRHVDDDHRRRLLVARQLLGPIGRGGRSIDEVVGALALVHSTDPATPYLSVAARSDASAADIEAWCYDDRAMLRHTTIRRTVFVMPLDVVPLAHNAVNEPLVAKLRQLLLGWVEGSDDTTEPAAEFLADTEEAVVGTLQERGAMSGTALAEAVPALQLRFEPAPGKSWSKPMRITSKVLEILAAEGRVVRGRPTGADFTSAAWTWEAGEARLPDGIAPLPTDEALAGLVARYLVTFAPATVTDLSWWTGTTKGRIRGALGALGAVEVALDDLTEPGFVLPDDDLDAPATEGAAALLPGLDSTVMGWKQRTWYVDDDPAAGLFDRNGNAGPTIWVDGRVVGVWTPRDDGEIATELVVDVGAEASAAIQAEVERISAWIGQVRVRWRYPTPITKRLVTG
ncbi:MAG: winged helix DNA-binding domain-containing protein [Actinomycetota bacterium]